VRSSKKQKSGLAGRFSTRLCTCRPRYGAPRLSSRDVQANQSSAFIVEQILTRPARGERSPTCARRARRPRPIVLAMRFMVLAPCVLAVFAAWISRPAPKPAASFEADVAPILQRKCTPCHYPGGKMYAKLPFDRPETIVKLGERLFTRIKDEAEREKIRRFLKAAELSEKSPRRRSSGAP
jgi:hypothetical protein